METEENDITIKEGDSSPEIVSKLPIVYRLLIDILASYLDITEENKHILALWCLAASGKDGFGSFPILYVNASKGSGKTRLLKLISNIVPRTRLAASLSESAIFRLPSQEGLNCLCIDEAERLNSKDKMNIQELLNQCYKKGGKVLRVEGQKKFIVKEYDVYMAVALANIWGLESVLEDRCITIVLERSRNKDIIGMPELFELDRRFAQLSEYLNPDVYEVHVVQLYADIQAEIFRYYVKYGSDTDQHVLYTSYTTFNPTYNVQNIIERIRSLELDGRAFEVWLPLLIISSLISDQCFEYTLQIAKNKVIEKNEQEADTDRDTGFALLLSNYVENKGNLVITKELIAFLEGQGDKKEWLTSEWIGRFLKRANIVSHRRRLARSYQYEIDKNKLRNYLDTRNVLIKSDTGQEDKPNPTLDKGQNKLDKTEDSNDGICEYCNKHEKVSLDINNKFSCLECISRYIINKDGLN